MVWKFCDLYPTHRSVFSTTSSSFRDCHWPWTLSRYFVSSWKDHERFEPGWSTEYDRSGPEYGGIVVHTLWISFWTLHTPSRTTGSVVDIDASRYDEASVYPVGMIACYRIVPGLDRPTYLRRSQDYTVRFSADLHGISRCRNPSKPACLRREFEEGDDELEYENA